MRQTVTLISSRSHGHQPPNQPGQPEPTRTTRACLLEFHCLHYRHSENKPPPNHDDYLKNLPLCKWENQKLKTWGYIVGSEARTQIKAVSSKPCSLLLPHMAELWNNNSNHHHHSGRPSTAQIRLSSNTCVVFHFWGDQAMPHQGCTVL